MRNTLVLTAALILAATSTMAQDIPPPPQNAQTADGSVPEPEITIRTEGETTVEEYRVGGQLYMVKITPKDAPPYYLVDRDGDGQLESRHNDPITPPTLPQWILLRW